MDIIKIFTALNGFVKSCRRLLLLLTSRSWRRFRFTPKSLWTGLPDWKSLTKLEARLKVELQMTESLALLEQTDLVILDVLTTWLTLLVLQTRLVTLFEQAGFLAIAGLASWITLLTLQILRSVALLKQTVSPTFNGLTS